jgi:chaperonin GroES
MDIKNVTMISTRLLVKVIEEESKTAGGLIIPQVAKEKPNSGKVLVSGPGMMTLKGELIANTVQAGDVIYFPKNAGNPITIDREDFLVIEEKDVLMVVGE